MPVKASTITILSVVPLQHWVIVGADLYVALPHSLIFTYSPLYQVFVVYSVPGTRMLPKDYNCERDRPNPGPHVAYVLQEPKFSNREHHMFSETWDLFWGLA